MVIQCWLDKVVIANEVKQSIDLQIASFLAMTVISSLLS